VSFFPFDATAQQRLGGFSPKFFTKDVFMVLLVITPMKIGGPKILGAENVHFWSQKFHTSPSSDDSCAEFWEY